MVREGGKQSGTLSRRKSKTSSSKCMWAEHQVGKPGIVFETRPRQLSVLPCLVHMRMSIYIMSCIIHVLYMYMHVYTSLEMQLHCHEVAESVQIEVQSHYIYMPVLLCLVCLTLLASFFFLISHLKTCIYIVHHVHVYHDCNVHVYLHILYLQFMELGEITKFSETVIDETLTQQQNVIKLDTIQHDMIQIYNILV